MRLVNAFKPIFTQQILIFLKRTRDNNWLIVLDVKRRVIVLAFTADDVAHLKNMNAVGGRKRNPLVIVYFLADVFNEQVDVRVALILFQDFLNLCDDLF